MSNIPLAQAKNQLSELVERARNGEPIAVTKRGKVVARLVPADETLDDEHHKKIQQAFARLAELSRGVHLEGDIKTIAREGLD